MSSDLTGFLKHREIESFTRTRTFVRQRRRRHLESDSSKEVDDWLRELAERHMAIATVDLVAVSILFDIHVLVFDGEQWLMFHDKYAGSWVRSSRVKEQNLTVCI